MGYIGNQPFLGTVTGDVVVDGTVGTADLTDGAVTAAKLATTAILDKLGYTPVSTAGTGATGTWGISISGNAATATTATNISGGTANVTTLSASGNVTLSGGTANGVLYLNGSKVATSGSSLSFNGTTLTAPQMTLTSANGITMNSASGGLIDCSGNTLFIQFPSSNSLIFRQSGSPFTEYMRLNSTGLGIGTTSPAGKLHVVGDSLSSTFKLIANTTVSGSDATIFRPADNTMAFSTNGLERLRIDSAGNLGIGTSSPSSVSKIDIQIGTSTSNYGLQVRSYDAGTVDGSTTARVFRTVNSGAGNWANAQYDAWSHIWTKSASSELMRLDSSGNLGIGTASPNRFVHLYSTDNWMNFQNASRSYLIGLGNTSNFTIYDNTGGTERLTVTSAGNVGIGTASPAFASGDGLEVQRAADATVRVERTGATASAGEFVASSGLVKIGATSGSPFTFITDNTERMRIDSSGNVGIGTASPSSKLHVAGGAGSTIRNTASSGSSWFVGSNVDSYILHNESNTPMLFTTNGSERMRIDSSGNVGIGGTAPAFAKMLIGGTLPAGSANSQGIRMLATIPSGATSAHSSFLSAVSTEAASFTLTNLFHFNAEPQSFGAGSAVTNQYGFYVASSLTGATNNYGFYSNIASGSNRWNFYAGGTANNYFAGKVGVGTTTLNVGFEVASTAVENDRALRVAYDTTYYFEIRNLGAAGARLRSNNGQMVFNITGTDYAELKTSGEFVTGGTTDNGAYNLQCNGTGVWGAGAYVNGSDARLKDNIQSLDSGLDIVAAMRPVTFQYKPEYSKDQSIQPGFIAQELQTAMAGKPYLDGVVQQGTNHLNVAYQNIIPILVKAIQELKSELDALKAQHGN